jgi:GNAT superfamily N-acetyltransferase
MDTEKKPYALPLLTPYLRDEIIFAMEDQERDYCMDLALGLPIPADEADPAQVAEDPERFLDLPEWTPADGFRMMERFANLVRNPYYRRRLIDALESGKGVFRRFKNTLSEQPALERQWFAYKDMEMERKVVAWYRGNHGASQLEELDPEPDELTDDLLQEDFVISHEPDARTTAEIAALTEALLEELRGNENATRQGALIIRRHLEQTSSLSYVYAKTQGGLLAGFIAYRLREPDTAEVLFFGNAPEFRGMGLFAHLFDAFSRVTSRKGIRSLLVPLAGNSLGLDAYFSRMEGTTVVKQVLVATDEWNASRPSSDIAYL